MPGFLGCGILASRDRAVCRSYSIAVGDDSRQWLADQLHAECDKLAGEPEASRDRAAFLRRRAAAWQVRLKHHSLHAAAAEKRGQVMIASMGSST